MTTEVRAYRDQLLLELRLRDVPGPRIAEALAEVDSHVAETGEGALESFGPPRAYADELAVSLGLPAGRGWWRTMRAGLTWREALVAAGAAAVSFAGTWLLLDGAVGLADGEPAVGGQPALGVLLAGLALLAALAGGVVLRTRAAADPVLDPRTGRDMAPRVPLWAWLVVCGGPVALPLAAVAVRLLTD
ncbi:MULTISPECIES: hypothetical protein [unclassified Actinotalea]|uniref:HAAS signaling domain-containing protein n=1 Tax=unclassified Actinotalea TaxID=2638618 RepID=UPI0015F6908F|nr:MULTISPECIES: hypothetical protein [unclassified Actinotalea]